MLNIWLPENSHMGWGQQRGGLKRNLMIIVNMPILVYITRSRRLLGESDRGGVFTGTYWRHKNTSMRSTPMHACTQMSGISFLSPPQTSPGPKPCSHHFNETTAIFHHGRCVAVATRPSHLQIPYWVCTYRLPPPHTNQSIILSSHLSLLIGLSLWCPPSKYWPSYTTDCRMTMRRKSLVPLLMHEKDSEK